VRHADLVEELQAVSDVEMAGQRRASSLARLAAEIRHHERRVAELVTIVTAPEEPAGVCTSPGGSEYALASQA
jgi:hypothetical protein